MLLGRLLTKSDTMPAMCGASTRDRPRDTPSGCLVHDGQPNQVGGLSQGVAENGGLLERLAIVLGMTLLGLSSRCLWRTDSKPCLFGAEDICMAGHSNCSRCNLPRKRFDVQQER